MTTLLVSTFKARCLAIMERVHTDGSPVIVTRRGKPLVRVVPARAQTSMPRKLGALAGEALATGDIVNTGLEHEWESAR